MNRNNALAALDDAEIQMLAKEASAALKNFMDSMSPRDLVLRAVLHTERKGRFSLKAVGAHLRDQAAAYAQSRRDLEAYGQGFEHWIQSDAPEQQRRPSVRRPARSIKAGKRRKTR